MVLPLAWAFAVKQKYNPILVALSEGINIPLDKPIVLIGRHQECDIQIPSGKISRRHCCIALVNDHLVIRDLGSTNGIRINGIKVVEGNLHANDEVIIGNVRYQVRLGGMGSGSDMTLPAGPQHGIRAGDPPIRPGAANEPSYEMPVALPDLAVANPSNQTHPPASVSVAAKADPLVKPGVFDLSDEIGLVPLEPPK